MAAIQEISARIGRVSGCGIAANLRKYYPKTLLVPCLIAVTIANIFNLGADLSAMGDALHLLLPLRVEYLVMMFGLVSLFAILFIPYSQYVKYLKWLTVSLFAYLGVVLFVKIEWHSVMWATLVPHLHFDKAYLNALAAVFGTTISPYLFFWQASQEVEEVRNTRGEKPLRRLSSVRANSHLNRIRTDTYFGMALSNVIAFFVILTTASTLHVGGVIQVSTSAQAAQALEPIAGHFAGVLFVLGIVGTGLLALPILAASAAYAIGEACRWNVSLEKTPREAARFYAVIAAATLLGLLLNVFHIDPLKALFWSAVVNGVVAGPLMGVIVMMASNKRIMGKFAIPTYMKYAGWIATGLMCLVGIGVFVS